jgi:hypothetical protein
MWTAAVWLLCQPAAATRVAAACKHCLSCWYFPWCGAELSKIPTLLFGTINGVIGVVASLPTAQYQLLEALQAAMRKVVKGVGGFDHAQVGADSCKHLLERFTEVMMGRSSACVVHLSAGQPEPVSRGGLPCTARRLSAYPQRRHRLAPPLACRSGARSATSTSPPRLRASLWMAI